MIRIRHSSTLYCFLVLVVLASSPIILQNAHQLYIEYTANKLATAENKSRAGDMRRQLFDIADPFDFDRLDIQSHSTVQLAVAWEKQRLQLPFESEDASRKGRCAFVIAMERHLNLVVPEWWRIAFVEADEAARSNLSFDKDTTLPYYVTEAGAMAPVNTDIIRLDDGVVVNVGGETAMILLGEEGGIDLTQFSSRRLLSASLDDNNCYLAMPPQIAISYPLYCISRASHSVQWVTEVWTGWRMMDYSGAGWFHCVTVQTSRDRVFVFGIAADVAYVEGFNVNDGMSIVRFTTAVE